MTEEMLGNKWNMKIGEERMNGNTETQHTHARLKNEIARISAAKDKRKTHTAEDRENNKHSRHTCSAFL